MTCGLVTLSLLVASILVLLVSLSVAVHFHCELMLTGHCGAPISLPEVYLGVLPPLGQQTKWRICPTNHTALQVVLPVFEGLWGRAASWTQGVLDTLYHGDTTPQTQEANVSLNLRLQSDKP